MLLVDCPVKKFTDKNTKYDTMLSWKFAVCMVWCVAWNFVIIVDKHRLVAAMSLPLHGVVREDEYRDVLNNNFLVSLYFDTCKEYLCKMISSLNVEFMFCYLIFFDQPLNGV